MSSYTGRGRYDAQLKIPGAWNKGRLIMGTSHFWVEGGKLYTKTSAPASGADGTVVGTQA